MKNKIEMIVTLEQTKQENENNIVTLTFEKKDIRPLIRCKDCKHRDEENANCTRFRKDWYVQSNSFCSWAERKPPQVNPEMVREMKERLEKYKND